MFHGTQTQTPHLTDTLSERISFQTIFTHKPLFLSVLGKIIAHHALHWVFLENYRCNGLCLSEELKKSLPHSRRYSTTAFHLVAESNVHINDKKHTKTSTPEILYVDDLKTHTDATEFLFIHFTNALAEFSKSFQNIQHLRCPQYSSSYLHSSPRVTYIFYTFQLPEKTEPLFVKTTQYVI